MRRLRVALVLLVSTMASCQCGPAVPAGLDQGFLYYDAGQVDSGTGDAGALDVVHRDAASGDITARDSALPDLGGHDVTGTDLASSHDASTVDAVAFDVATQDQGSADLGLQDSSAPDRATTDLASVRDSTAGSDTTTGMDVSAGSDAATTPDAGAPDTATPDTSPPDLGGYDLFSNHAPSVAAGGDRSVLPGESVTITATASDPDNQALAVLWTAQAGFLPSGVSIANPTGLNTSVVVNRALYASGPAPLAITLVVTVTDPGSLQDSDLLVVTILDERGPYVANTSSFEGTGYAGGGARHGYCGHALHPCRGVDDALINLRDLIDDGSSEEPVVKVATTATPYARTQPVLLNNGLSLRCAYRAGTWDRPLPLSRTPFAFAGSTGLSVAYPDLTVENCAFSASSTGGTTYTERLAGIVHSGGVLLRGCLFEGSDDAATAGHGLGLRIDTTSSTEVVVETSQATGGNATRATGLELVAGTARLVDSTVWGARAGSTDTTVATGVLQQAATTLVTEEGRVSSGPGLLLAAGIQSLGGTLRVRGSEVDAADTSAAGGTSHGITAISTTLVVENSTLGTFALLHSGAADDISTALSLDCSGGTATTAQVDGAELYTGNVVGSGSASTRAASGIYINACAGLTLSDCTLDVGAAQNGVSYGVRSEATPVTSRWDMIAAAGAGGTPGHCAAIRVDDAPLDLQGSALSCGAAVNSHGAWLYNGSGSQLVDGQALAGPGLASNPQSRSNGVRITAFGGVLTGLVVDGMDIQADDAAAQSHGLFLGNGSDGTQVLNSTLRGGAAAESTGATIAGSGNQSHTGLVWTSNSAQAGTGRVNGVSATPALSAGLWFSKDCHGCTIARSQATGGPIAQTTPGRSVGARFVASATLDPMTFITANVLTGGAAARAHGVEIDGLAGDSLRFLNNNVYGGGVGTGTSHGLVLGWVLDETVELNMVGIVVGNIIGAGLGSQGFNIFENISCSGNVKVRAEPYSSLSGIIAQGGRNNDLWPAGGSGLLNNGENSPCRGVTVTSIDVVNQTVPYQADLINSNDRCWSVDPLFDATRLPHLQSISPLKDRAYRTPVWVPLGMTLLDVDGVARQAVMDIGCDEI
ncbi:MAG: hypothetical protein ABIJ09_19830 [Pseudomonadota bacterium]